MAQNGTATTDAPIHNDIVRTIADEYDVDADALGEFLADANTTWSTLLSDLREHHEVIEETDDRLLVLAGHGEEVDEMAAHLADDHQAVGFWEPDATPGELLRVAHDCHARTYEHDAFGGTQAAVDAVGAADAVLVQKDD